jgi:hypothetical protein
MKITCISDTHNKHHEIPLKYLQGGDCIIHSGDISSRGTKFEIEGFLDWFDELPYTHKILIAGNHDFYFEQSPEYAIEEMLSQYPSVTYLNDSGVEIDGIRFWGSPVQPYFGGWAFNRVGAEICNHWDLIPLDIDVLITHGPANGYLDLTKRGDSCGCPYLLEQISKIKDLKLFVHGHIHEAYGRIEFPDGGVFLNASVLDHNYKMSNLPLEIEINK